MNNVFAQHIHEPDSTYDEVPYPVLTFSQTHPDLMATMSRLFGINAADPTACRLLEIGCGTGANLLFMAYTLPKSEFVGIDLSAVQIDIARNGAEELGLTNVRFEQRDITTLDPAELGIFDYAVGHGVYSWVPEEVRKGLWRIYSACLAENGIGFVSYNSYPGCHIRQMVWEPMRFHVADIDSGLKKVEEGKKFLAALTNSAKVDSTLRAILWEELKRIVEKPVGVVYHDEFESTNQPFYFHEFISDAREVGLKFLAEANPKWLDFRTLPIETQNFLTSMESDPQRREQYLDFIRCSRFRNVLLCRKDLEPRSKPDVDAINNFFIAAEIAPVSPDERIDDDRPKRFKRPGGDILSVDHPLTKAALVYLGEAFPRRVNFQHLMTETLKQDERDHADDSGEIEKTARHLADAYIAGYIRLHSYEPKCAYTVSEYPVANTFARWQQRSGGTSIAVFNEITDRPEHEIFDHLLPLLDGTRSHDDLIDAMKTTLNVPPAEAEEFENKLPAILDANLAAMANAGLLVD